MGSGNELYNLAECLQPQGEFAVATREQFETLQYLDNADEMPGEMIGSVQSRTVNQLSVFLKKSKSKTEYKFDRVQDGDRVQYADDRAGDGDVVDDDLNGGSMAAAAGDDVDADNDEDDDDEDEDDDYVDKEQSKKKDPKKKSGRGVGPRKPHCRHCNKTMHACRAIRKGQGVTQCITASGLMSTTRQ